MALGKVIDLDALEVFCRRLAPVDLAGLPLYLIDGDTLPPDRTATTHGGLIGYTYEGLDADIRDVLGERWRGRGPALIVSANAVRDYYHESVLADVIEAVVLHELAHVLALGTGRDRTAPDAPARMEPEQLKWARFMAGPLPKAEEGERVEADTHHGAEFVRVAVHLLARAEELGRDRVEFFDRIVAANEGTRACYGMGYYRWALRADLARFSDVSFAAIMATPVPPELVSLVDGECADWLPPNIEVWNVD